MISRDDANRLWDQLARMGGFEPAEMRRLVLVLDLEDVPRLYTESLVRSYEPLEQIELQVRADTPVRVRTEGGLRVERIAVRDIAAEQLRRYRQSEVDNAATVAAIEKAAEIRSGDPVYFCCACDRAVPESHVCPKGGKAEKRPIVVPSGEAQGYGAAQ